MEITGFRRITRSFLVLILLSIFLPATGLYTPSLADGPGEVEYLLRAPLIRAGIAINRESLIQALGNKDVLIAGNSAILLARFPKTRTMVEALTALVETDKDPYRETVVVNAARTLLKINERKWEASALARLPRIQDRVAQVQLAGVLAQAGHADGWPVVRATLLDQGLALVAIENVFYFNGMKDKNGRTIDVTAELRLLSSQVPESTRRLIEEKLRERH